MLLAWALGVAGSSAAAPARAEKAGIWLVRIDTSGSIASFPLPVYSQGTDAAGQEYVLIKAAADDLERSGQAYQVLDARAESAAYVLAHEFRPGARAAAQGRFDVVHDDGKGLVVRSVSGGEVEALADLGFQCRWLGATPLDLVPASARGRAAVPRMAAVASNASVSAMMAQVQQSDLVEGLSGLTGEQPVLVGGSSVTIHTRNQNSGLPLRQATQLAQEHFAALGLQTSYHSWTNGGRSNRNVVGVLPGTRAPSEIVVVCAHIDDMPSTGDAPGADDNASGSIGVFTAAEILSAHAFERTLRFILFTGEEQGLLGSESYALAAQAAGDDVVAVLNLDMVAWDGNGDNRLNLYVRPVSNPGHAGDREIAATFTNVVRTYGLQSGLAPAILAENSGWSDHYSFQSLGFPAICAIEEDGSDFNPYYHTANDTLAHLHLPYYTRFVKAVVGTAAHLAGPAGPGSTLVLTPSNRTHSSAGAAGQTIDVVADVAWTAATNVPWLRITAGAAGTTNGTVTYGVAANAGAFRSGTIAVSGGGLVRTCTVNQTASILPPGSRTESDFDFDGAADAATFQAAGGIWSFLYGGGGSGTAAFGWSATVPVPADYDGDGRNDVAVYHPASGTWYVRGSFDGQTRAEAFGWRATIPLPGDYDGDGLADRAVFHRPTARWYFRYSAGGPDYNLAFGWSAVLPVPADYDGDGVVDLAVYHPATGTWYVHESSTGDVVASQLGGGKALPVPADYDGDGAADVAVFTRATAQWQVTYSGGGSLTMAFGWSAVLPVPADYDGDGAADLAIYHSAGGKWYVRQSSDLVTVVKMLGGPGKNPVLLNSLIHSWFRLY